MKKAIEIAWYNNRAGVPMDELVTLRLTAESTSAAEVESAIRMLRVVYELSDPAHVRTFYEPDDHTPYDPPEHEAGA